MAPRRHQLCSRILVPPIVQEGKKIGAVVTFVNITERKQVEEAVRESERRYRLLFERNLAGVFRTTMEGLILECNQAAARMFGCASSEEVLGTSIVDVYQTISDREAFLKQLKNEKYVTNYEVNYRRTNGDSAWAMLNATVVADDSGKNSFIEGTFVDITERKVAEQQIQSLAYFDALTGLPTGLFCGTDYRRRSPMLAATTAKLLFFSRPRPVQEHQRLARALGG